MKITRNNFEGYFTAYWDGNLTSAEIRELHCFLLLNEDLAELLEETKDIKVIPETIHYPRKALLRKDELHACPDYYHIAKAENCLSPEDLMFLKHHPEQISPEINYKKIKLIPDTHLKYKHKNKLYRPTYTKTLLLKWGTFAATFILFLGITNLWNYHTVSKADKLTESHILIPHPETVLPLCLPLPVSQAQITPTISLPDQLQPYRIKSDMTFIFPSIRTFAVTKIETAENHYSLATGNSGNISLLQPEIFLAEEAREWRSSVINSSTDNIFSSMIHTGKLIAEKIKKEEVTN